MKRAVTKISNTKIKNNLRRWVNDLSVEDEDKGKTWYSDAQAFAGYLSRTYNIDGYIAATVISALSPNNKWDRNKFDAEEVIKCWLNGGGPEDIKVCTYNANKIKAFKALDGELISEKSPKTHAFAMNIGLLSGSHVTIDKWHLRACVTRPSDGVQDCMESCIAVQYRRLEALTLEVAKEYGFKGYEFQAIVWLKIKEAWGR